MTDTQTPRRSPARRRGEPLPAEPIIVDEYRPTSPASLRRPAQNDEADTLGILEDTIPILPAYRPERLT